MYEFHHELPNDVKFRILVNFKKIYEILGFDREYPVNHPKAKL